MSAYTTPKGNRYGDPAKWFIYKSRWTNTWHIVAPRDSRIFGRREDTFDAARNYLIEQLESTK